MIAADLERAQALVDALRETRERIGFIPPDQMDVAREELGVDRSTVYRWLRHGLPKGRAGAALTREEIVALFDHYGVVAHAWAELHASGQTQKSRATFYRAAGQLPEIDLLYASEGLPGARRAQLRLERRESHTGRALIADHLLADVEVVLPGKGAKRVRPWLTGFEEPRSRALAGLVISVRPTRAEVLAGLGEAMRRTPEFSPVYGLPTFIRTDNGREFLTKALRSAQVELGFSHLPLRRRSPWLNGKIERWHQTIEHELFARMPWYLRGPKRSDGHLDVPDDVAPLPLAVFVKLVRAWVAEYNFDRPHRSLGGATPAQAWAEDPAEINEVSEPKLRRYLLEAPRGPRIVEPRGVYYNLGYYNHGELQDYVTRKVTLRVMPHDDLWVDVYHQGQYVCRAVRQQEASAQQRQTVLDSRAAAARRAAGISHSAKRKAKVRWASMHGDAPEPKQINSISENDAALQESEQLRRVRDLGQGQRLGRRRGDPS